MATQIQRYYRSILEVWEACKRKSGVFEFTTQEENEPIILALTSMDRDAWAKAYRDAARPLEEKAQAAEARGDRASALESYLHAFGLYRTGRYPTTNSPGKLASYWKSMEMFGRANRLSDRPVERVEIPFHGQPGEGDKIIALLDRPKIAPPWPVLIHWGGIDGYKEDRKGQRAEAFKADIATLTIDMPGVGEAPLKGSENAGRMWDPILDWIAASPELDERRVALWGGSTGGYWAAKLAHTHRDRIAAAVAHGGPYHLAFFPDWIEKAQHGEYPFELAEALAYSFGLETFEEWVEYAPGLSLLNQGILDQPCAPTLVVNGVNDTIFPTADSYLLLEHGDPKAARFYPGGHMGRSPGTAPTIVGWIARTMGLRPRG